MENNQANKAPKFKGEILVCEDNEINQHFIKTQLNRVGLDAEIANDGREGIDAVQNRMIKNKPFDLIFMDIQMPVMGGLEAAAALVKMGIKTPIIALTSNVTQDDLEEYKKHGMPRALCKPFTPEELWACLSDYITPSGSETVSAETRRIEDEKQQIKLFSSFVRRNQTTYEDICAALDGGDVKLAHRLAHTLRGLAGLMGKQELMEAARIVEHSLAGGSADTLDKSALETMGRELKTVLAELAPYLESANPEPAAGNWDKAAARELFEKLEPLLLDDNASVQQYVEALRAIPETSDLIVQIEDYEFEKALEALEVLKKKLEI